MTIASKTSAWKNNPNYRIEINPIKHRVQVIYNQSVIANSTNALLIQESNYKPLYYFPKDDVQMKFLQASSNESFCPFKGDARHWSITNGEKHVAIAAWCYESPFPEVERIKGCISFYPDVIEDIILG